jgi:hypothetical protein
MSSILRRIALAASSALVASACGRANGLLIEPHPAAQCRELSTATVPFAGRADTLFSLVPETSLNGEQAALVAAARHQEWTARVVVARIAPGADSLLQAGRAVTLVVSPAYGFVAVGHQAERRASGDLFWTGALQGQTGGSTILLTSLGVTGSVQSIPPGAPYSLYAIAPIGGGLHTISCIDPTLIPPD